METPLPPPHVLPYDQASPRQVSQALLFLQEELQQHFPTLDWVTWANALRKFRPDLWVAGNLVSLDYADVTHLTQLLAASPQLPQLEPLIQGPRAAYLSQRLIDYQDEAIDALTDIEANPLAYGSRVYALVQSLALGNSVADTVFQATHREPQGRPGAPDPAAARLNVHPRLAALRHARGGVGYAPAPAGSTPG